jgi:poly-gamma-glutamate synthesis protein (capsule biosynthesis protein)
VDQYQGKPIIYSLGNFVFDGFADPDSNTGWLLRMEADRSGVRSWRTYVAHMDSKGTPHPDSKSAGLCWERGQEKAAACIDKK